MANGVLAIVDDVQPPAQRVLQCVGKAGNQAVAPSADALFNAIYADITRKYALVLLPLALGFVEID